MTHKTRNRARGLVDGPLCRFVRGRDCSVPGCRRAGEPHHVDHAGLRLDWLVMYDGLEAFGLQGNVAPLCPSHHRELHQYGPRTFAYTYDLDLEAVAVHWGHAYRDTEPAGYRRILEAV